MPRRKRGMLGRSGRSSTATAAFPLTRAGRTTVISTIKGFLRRRGLADRSPFKGFLRDTRGVIHVGAHVGQERERYSQYGLRVLWVEPLPDHFAALQRNIAAYRDQR